MPRKPKPEPAEPAPLKLGAHMSIAGGYDRAVRAAHAVGFGTVQLFTKNNNQWKGPPITDDHVAAFRGALAETGIVDPVSHASYLINMASPDEALWTKSIDAMVIEVERCARLGIADLVVHPGAHVGSGEEEGLRRIAKALDVVAGRTAGLPVMIDLETTAGQGSCLGHRFEHLQAILGLASDPSRLGVCVDTCHIFAAGYSMAEKAMYDETLDQLERTVGLGRIRVWHLNDSVKPRASRVDRHAGIGGGMLGLDSFRFVLNDPRFRGLPMILETPKGFEDGEELDARNRRILLGLLTP